MSPLFSEAAQVLAFAVFFLGTARLAVIDARSMLLPNRVVYPVAATGSVLFVLAAGCGAGWARAAAAFCLAAAAMAVFYVLHRCLGLGLGDVRLAGLLALFLGWLGPAAVFAGLLYGTAAAALAGVFLLATGRIGSRGQLAYGPFLVVGAWLALLVRMR